MVFKIKSEYTPFFFRAEYPYKNNSPKVVKSYDIKYKNLLKQCKNSSRRSPSLFYKVLRQNTKLFLEAFGKIRRGIKTDHVTNLIYPTFPLFE